MGTCDAFCDISWNGQERKTSIKKNSYSPDWDETFTFSLHDVAAVGDLTLVVLDFDRLTDPDQVGKVVSPLLGRPLLASTCVARRRVSLQCILPLSPPSTLDPPALEPRHAAGLVCLHVYWSR